MSKEEILKIQKCVLKVNIHCDGCKHKVKKILQKIDGVFTTEIDSEQGKVIVSGNVDPNVLIKKLAKSGKHAELWGAPKSNNNQNQITNQLKNMQIDGKSGGNNNNKGQNQNQKGGGNNQPKGGGGQQMPNPQQQQQQLQQQLQQLQQLQQMKGFSDLKLPQFKDMKLPQQNPNQKVAKFSMLEDDGLSDDDYDDDYDEEDFDDEVDGEMDELHLSKMKPGGGQPMMGNGAAHMMLNGMLNGNHAQLMNNAQKGGGNGGGNGKKGVGGGGSVPIHVQGIGGGNDGKNGNGGKKGGGGGGNNQNQGGNKNGGESKNGNNGGGGNKNGNNGHGGGGSGGNNINNGGKKSEVVHAMNNGFQSMGGANGGRMSMPMGMQMGQMGNIPAVQGLPAASMNGGGGGGAAAAGGYFQGAGLDAMPGNAYHQQMAAMMNQQRAMGNDRFQPMMYARPPPAVNYMPPQPYGGSYGYGYGYHNYPSHPDQYSSFFSDENTSSCNIM